MNLLNGWKCHKCGCNELMEREAGIVKHLRVDAVRKDGQGHYVEARTVLEETGAEYPSYLCRGCNQLIGGFQDLIAVLTGRKK